MPGFCLRASLQGVECFGGHGRPVLVTRLLVFGTPPDGPALHVDIRPPKLADGTDTVSRLVRDHQCHAEAPVHQQRRLEQGLVLRIGEKHPGRVLLLGRLQAPQGVGLQKEPAHLISRPRCPVEDREQELQVVFDGSVGYRPAARADLARASRPMNRSQSRWESVAGLRFRPKNLRNIAIAALSYLRDRCALVGVTSSR